MRELIQVMAQALVDNPEQVSVEEVQGDHTTVFELRVAKSDLGKVIGKSGRNADAIRTILGAVSAKERKRAILEIVDSFQMQAADRTGRGNRSELPPARVYTLGRKSA